MYKFNKVNDKMSINEKKSYQEQIIQNLASLWFGVIHQKLWCSLSEEIIKVINQSNKSELQEKHHMPGISIYINYTPELFSANQLVRHFTPELSVVFNEVYHVYNVGNRDLMASIWVILNKES